MHLYEDRRYARALSLSVTGQEEVGKSVLFTLTAVGRVEVLAEEWQNRIRQHHLKQLLSEAAADALAIVEDYFAAVATEAPVGPPSAVDWATEALEQTADWVTDLVETPDKAREEYQRRKEEALERRRDSGLSDDMQRPIRTREEARRAGLYVDVQDGEVLPPRRVSEQEAWTNLNRLRAGLASARHLRQCLEDEALWTELLTRFDGNRDGADGERNEARPEPS